MQIIVFALFILFFSVCFLKNWSTWYFYFFSLIILSSLQSSSVWVAACSSRLPFCRSETELVPSRTPASFLHLFVCMVPGVRIWRQYIVLTQSALDHPEQTCGRTKSHSNSDHMESLKSGWQTEIEVSSVLLIKDKEDGKAQRGEPSRSAENTRTACPSLQCWTRQASSLTPRFSSKRKRRKLGHCLTFDRQTSGPASLKSGEAGS